MSIDVLNWVLEESDAKHGSRLVLIVLAECANADGGGSYPSVETMRRRSRLEARSGVQKALAKLKKEEHVVEEGTHSSGTKIYRVVGPFNATGAESVSLDDPANAQSGQGASTVGPPDPESAEAGGLNSDLQGAYKTHPGGLPQGTGGASPSRPEPTHEPTTEPKEDPPGARARVSVPPDLQPIIHSLQRVVDAKSAKRLKLSLVLADCGKFADRDLRDEAERFERYWIDGAGENRKRRDINSTWRNWLESAPSRGARNGNGTRRGPNADRVQELLDRGRSGMEGKAA